jgi:ectoine hydroxylase-related dioxygenase (phytanoyl-CoA dioxygenase family)
MWFVPRSHKMAVLEHQSINNDPRIHGLELTPDQMPYVQDPVACPLPPGGCTIHYSRTLHYTGPNTSDIPRRAYILGGSAPAERRSDGRRFPWLEQQRTARMQRQQAAQP